MRITITLISSSRKSRMVDEMAKLVLTIPFNLRNPDESKGKSDRYMSMVALTTVTIIREGLSSGG